jgi:hypothetical protein
MISDDFSTIRKRQIEIHGQDSPLVTTVTGSDGAAHKARNAYLSAQGLKPVPWDMVDSNQQEVWRKVVQAAAAGSRTSTNASSYYKEELAQKLFDWRRRVLDSRPPQPLAEQPQATRTFYLELASYIKNDLL